MKIAARLLILGLLLGGGCARYPENRDNGLGGKQIEVSFTVSGRIRQDYHYFVLLNQTNDGNNTPGPVPVIDSPWGNGFAAPSRKNDDDTDAQGFNAFVSYDPIYLQGSGGNYGLSIVNGSAIYSAFQPLGLPDFYEPVPEGGNTIRFRLSLARLRRAGDTADPAFIQVNILATNNLPRNDETNAASKSWDALGDARFDGALNSWVTIPIAQNTTYTDDNTGLSEPSGDVREKLLTLRNDPDLDITSWRIRILSQ